MLAAVAGRECDFERGTGRQAVDNSAGVDAVGADMEDGLPVRLSSAPVGEDAGRYVDAAAGLVGDGVAQDAVWTGWGGRGPARRTTVMGKPRVFHDGGGLCSPGRWEVGDRRLPVGVGGNWFVTLKGMLGDYWRKKSGGKDDLCGFALRLAAKQVTENPFDDAFLDQGRVLLQDVFGLNGCDFEVAPRQCFRLGALSKVLKAYGDPDWMYPV